MPTSTEVALATTVLSASAATITFSSISGSYTDLRLVLKGTTDAAGNQFELTFNGVTTGTTYSKTHLYGSAATGTAGNFNGTVNAVIFNTTSDIRLKENIEPITDSHRWN